MPINSNKLVSNQFLVLIIILCVLVGCQTTINKKIRTDFSITFKEAEKIPLSVGLYLDHAFMDYTKIGGGLAIQMGGAFSKGAVEIANKAFKEVIIIDSPSIPKGVEAIIIPRVDKVYSGGIGDEITRQYSYFDIVVVKINWTIKDINGKIVYMNTFSSEIEYRRAPLFGVTERLCEAYDRAVEDQFRKAFIGITSVNWWGAIKKGSN